MLLLFETFELLNSMAWHIVQCRQCIKNIIEITLICIQFWSRWLGIGHILCGTVALLIDLAKLLLAGDHLHQVDDNDCDGDGDCWRRRRLWQFWFIFNPYWPSASLPLSPVLMMILSDIQPWYIYNDEVCVCVSRFCLFCLPPAKLTIYI